MAVNSSKLLKLSSSRNSENKSNFNVGKIDPRILKILGVSEFDIEDEQEYLSLLKEKMLLITMGKSKLSREDEELIIDEFKRIKSKKFPKKKKITVDNFKRGTASGINSNLGKKLGAGIKPLALSPAIAKMSGKRDLEQIQDSLTAIIGQLTILNGLTKKSAEKGRREKENARRGAREKDLESGFSKALNIAEKVIAPVKSILQKIIDFFLAVFIGRSLILLLEWFNNPANKKKVDTILRFLGDHWPKLLALFVAFGTGLGGFARGIIKLAIWGTGALIKAATGLAARAGIKGAAGALKFLGGPKGKLIGMGLELAAVAGGTFALSKGIEEFGGIGGEKEEQPQTPKARFSGGGFANFGKMFGGSGFNPVSTPLGSGGEEQKSNGFVSGQSGVDKVPAMLTDGEFVMSTGAVQKYGVDTLEAMNSAGGGTNQPKVVGGKTYAAGGGPVGRGMKDSGIDSIKKFIKYKIGYDVDRPETWGTSFSSVFANKSSESNPPISKGKGFDFISVAQGLANQARGIVNTATDPRTYSGLGNKAQGIVNTATNLAKRNIPSAEDIVNTGTNVQKRGKELLTSSQQLKPFAPIGNLISNIASKKYFGENSAIEEEKKLGLMKPGADSLTDNTKKKLSDRDAYVRGLYNPEKDKGIGGFFKKNYQDIQNRGLIRDPAAMLGLKEEGTEKFVEKISEGRIKNLGAKITGLQFAAKGLAGPLGRAFQIDDRGSLGRYLRPGMMEAQKKGHGGVGAGPLGQETYDKLVDDKIANLALGQTSFRVDKSGRAKTSDVFDSNQTAESYFKQSRQGLKAFGNLLQGKEATIGEGKNLKKLTGLSGGAKALYETAFKGLSGILRVNQNKGGNLRPMGNDIDLGGGFKPTDEKGKVLSGQQIKAQKQKSPIKLYKPNDPRRKNTGVPYKSKFAKPSKPEPTGVTPPSKSQTKVTYVPNKNTKRNVRGGGTTSSAKPKAPQFNASSPKASKSKSLYGVRV